MVSASCKMRSTFGNSLRTFRSSTDIKTSFACFAGRTACARPTKPVPDKLSATGRCRAIPRNHGLGRAPGE
ncbi:hypothetical protein B1209_05060 [Raoultella planticola]|nr:hypothetical protein B1209_05060 [Raoultella planticola]